MNRITEKQLQSLVNCINTVTGSPMKPWNNETTPMTANIGNYHLSFAYGGVALHQICTNGGGVIDVFSSGHMPKRELYQRMSAWFDGYCAKADEARGEQ